MILQKSNHRIVDYKQYKIIRPFQADIITYEPIYERIYPLYKVYWDGSRSERIYLISDTQGINCEGKFIEVDTINFENLSIADKEMFWELLCNNGYTINSNYELEIIPDFGDILINEEGRLVLYLSDGYHTPTNEIIDCTVTRYATETEKSWFFEEFENQGFLYDIVLKQITRKEPYYYFPSYSLYHGFQPEKKKWINSEADRFYKKYGEVFDNFDECANFCNAINKTLNRDYPKY